MLLCWQSLRKRSLQFIPWFPFIILDIFLSLLLWFLSVTHSHLQDIKLISMHLELLDTRLLFGIIIWGGLNLSSNTVKIVEYILLSIKQPVYYSTWTCSILNIKAIHTNVYRKYLHLHIYEHTHTHCWKVLSLTDFLKDQNLNLFWNLLSG